jgi:large subunit ribosomal protein L21
LRDVLMVTDGANVSVGSPLIADAMVVAEVLGHGKARKVISFKYKAKTRYRRKRGHRQGFTKIAVREILTDGARPAQAETAAPARRPSRAAAPAPAEEEEPLAAPVAESVTETESAEEGSTPPDVSAPAPEAEATPTRRRRRASSEESTQD